MEFCFEEFVFMECSGMLSLLLCCKPAVAAVPTINHNFGLILPSHSNDLRSNVLPITLPIIHKYLSGTQQYKYLLTLKIFNDFNLYNDLFNIEFVVMLVRLARL